MVGRKVTYARACWSVSTGQGLGRLALERQRLHVAQSDASHGNAREVAAVKLSGHPAAWRGCC